MEFILRNITGIPLTLRGIVRTICTLLFFAFCLDDSSKLIVLIIWFTYLFVDRLGERIAKANWTKQIVGKPLNRMARKV